MKHLTLPPIASAGQPLAAIDTPALVLDLDAFERNLDRLQAAADAAGVKLRPHGKAHKTPAVALAQIARGAVGICCQKVSEALPFIEAGVADIHISNEIASLPKAALLAQAALVARMSVCVDDIVQVDMLGQAAAQAGSRLGVFVEIDIGHGRCGVTGIEGVLPLLDRIARHPQLEFRGLQAYHGTLQHLRSHAERRERSARAAARAGEVVLALEARGVRCGTVTGGGSGSAEFDFASGVFTEIQAGSYAFMDRDYGDNEYTDTLRFEHAMFLACTVMSTAAKGHAVVDAGLKSLTTDSGLPGIWPPGRLRYHQASDEHGVVHAIDGPLPALGQQLLLVPGHCDPTINLHDQIVCLRAGVVEALWPVSSRGLSR
ncbi:DSD1 family PLP-dependent enzyme [Xylophilus rhododendri]|uniref:DSD1 family PLP-dependent enzyme n=1 Tax=Xylophilus rhododendri TaxID=2697032 RepID=A0A857J5U0_9BURK|nr:DSD1 family PLP-dependent enzyme [Xylophilus rhododendri]QHI98603.1 DSD1 family PLP-dependent enzyme [Xylophilus rhododendri]